MSPYSLHHSLLAPAVLHILRAAGFHSTRPSVLDTLTDLCARYILLLSSRLAESSYNRAQLPSLDSDVLASLHDLLDDGEDIHPLASLSTLDHDSPNISDLRQALASVNVFASALTSTEEAWQELFRKPLEMIPLAGREKERNRRDLDDTKDVRDFLEWITGPVNKEIRRVGGVLLDDPTAISTATAAGSTVAFGDSTSAEKLDYLATLKKKHSKTADETRFSGTALGRMSDDKGQVKFEGGPDLTELRHKRRFDGEDAAQGTSTKKVVT